MIALFTLLAQATSQPRTAQPAPGIFASPIMMLALMGIVMYFLVFRPQSGEKKRREEMLKSVKKNDRVVTVGGILGVVQVVQNAPGGIQDHGPMPPNQLSKGAFIALSHKRL